MNKPPAQRPSAERRAQRKVKGRRWADNRRLVKGDDRGTKKRWNCSAFLVSAIIDNQRLISLHSTAKLFFFVVAELHSSTTVICHVLALPTFVKRSSGCLVITND